MYFCLGGGTCEGHLQAWSPSSGAAYWSWTASCTATLVCPEIVELPEKETQRRRRETTPQWPIMHAVLDGVTRDQMMARHKSNHIQVVYAPNAKTSPPRLPHQSRHAPPSLAWKCTCAATSL